jgi:DUF4097 and DUF4098 domain-containing protein YvlB
MLVLTFSLAADEEVERSFDMGGIGSLAISYRWGDITVALTDGSSLVIKERLRRTASAGVETAGGTLRITGARMPWFFGWTARNIAHIAVPRSFQGSLYIDLRSGTLKGVDDFSVAGEAEINLSSGIVEIRRLEAQKINLRISSGTFRSGGLYGESRIKVSSGSIDTGELEGSAHRLEVSSGKLEIGRARGNVEALVSSGNFFCDELEGSAHRLEARSGNLRIRRGRGSFDASVRSGNIIVEMAALEGDLAFNARSGDVRLTLPRDAAFNLDAETSSGNVSVKSFDGSYAVKGNSTILRPIGENPRYTVFARVTSGNVEIIR